MTEDLYAKIISIKNLILAWKRTRKGKTKKDYVKEFEKNLSYNLKLLQSELKYQIYKPEPLKTFIICDPKTRKISKSDFRDRIIHHALCQIIEPLFDKSFIYDSCANRIGKGTLFAVKRFEHFQRKVTNNLQTEAFCLKADIKHYFQEIDRKILLNIIKRKISDEKTLNLINLILKNHFGDKGMPLGNLTSQFFANVYLNELDYFIKHKLKAKYYIRYVDDFLILHQSDFQLIKWKKEIKIFLREVLKLELHSEKSKILSLSRGVDFVGFRNFYYHRLLRKRNIKKMGLRVKEFKENRTSQKKFTEELNGWEAYTKWGNCYSLNKKLLTLNL